MVLTRTDENELLTALHGGLCEELPWRLFLDRLCARTEADVGRLSIRAAGDGEWRSTDHVRSRFAGPAVAMPQPPTLDALRPGRVYAQAELSGGDTQGGDARHIRVTWPDGGDLAVSILSCDGDFGARDSSLLASLAPHLLIALRGRLELDATRRRMAVATGLLADGFGEGWLLLDGRGRILDSDREARLLLEEGKLARRLLDGRLRLSAAAADALLQDAIAGEAPVETRSGWLSIEPPVQMLVTAPPDFDALSLAPPRCMLVLRHMDRESAGDAGLLASLFGLTRSEASLATRIAGGESLAEAADAMQLTIETARNYSKRIYAKTGVRGQAELVRLVLEGVRSPQRYGPMKEGLGKG
jgi:DNA-binding CsgD family transcriptional regulator